MKRSQLLLLVTLLSGAIVIWGCSSSKQSSRGTEGETNTPPTQPAVEKQATKEEQRVPPRVDTVNVDVQNTQKPSYEQKSLLQSNTMPTGRYSVQVGAYKMADNADRIAALAKERYNKNVYTIQDKNDNLYKVMIGDFTTKDEARKFRDEMVQQFPSDYKDAWVSENPQK